MHTYVCMCMHVCVCEYKGKDTIIYMQMTEDNFKNQ